MRIALLSHEYPPETGFGGIGTYTWYHARALAKLGHEVHVLAGATCVSALRSEERDGVRVHRLRSGGLTAALVGAVAAAGLGWTRARLLNGLDVRRGLRALARRHAFDVIEMPESGAEGWLLPRPSDVPIVVKLHSPAKLIARWYGVPRLDGFLSARLERAGLRRARGFSSPTAFLAREAARGLGVRAPIRVVPYGLDLALFDAADASDPLARLGLPRDRPIVLFAARAERRKGIHLCEQIAATVLRRHACAFVFAGEDPTAYVRERLLPLLRAQPLRGSIHYVGKLGLDEVRACLRRAAIFLLPSLWDNSPYGCLEAMAAGCAVVCSDAGGLPELVRDGETGLLAATGDAAAHAAAIERLLEDSALRDRLATAARRAVEARHGDVATARMAVDHYTEVLQPPPA